MLGDQAMTDLRGAKDAGLAAALVESGVDRWSADMDPQPDWVVTSLV
jgi:ribonucleotide monophosphatase NagD (HAD superfamily)